MTKTIRSSKSVAEITEKLVSWAKTWPTYRHIESEDHEITLAQKSIYFSFTLERHDPQQSPHAKNCPKATFGHYYDCYNNCNRFWLDRSESEEEIMPCSEEQQDRCREFDIRTTVSGRIEDRDYGSTPAVAAIMLTIDGKPTDQRAREKQRQEIESARTFFKQLFGEDILIEQRVGKPKFQAKGIGEIVKFIQTSEETTSESPTPTTIPPTENSVPQEPSPSHNDQSDLRLGSVQLYRINDRIYAHGDFAHCPKEDILHNFRVLRQVLLERSLVALGKNYDHHDLHPRRKPITPEEWETIQRHVAEIYKTDLIDITEESSLEFDAMPTEEKVQAQQTTLHKFNGDKKP